MKNTLTNKKPRDRLNSRMAGTEEDISELEDKTIEIDDLEKKASETYGSIKLHLKCVPLEFWKERIKEGRSKKVLKEIMAENLPNFKGDVNLQIHEAERIQNWIYSKKSTHDNSMSEN